MTNLITMLSINQISERSGLARHCIRQLCLQNKICYIKAGNKYLINYEKFIEFLNTGETIAPCTAGIRDLSKVI